MEKLTLVPAYGRDYKSKKEVLKDFKEGKDFQVATLFTSYSGSYTNLTDLIKLFKSGQVFIRYSKLTKIIKVDF